MQNVQCAMFVIPEGLTNKVLYAVNQQYTGTGTAFGTTKQISI